MIGFFHFWWECVLKGWELGEHTFSAIETICTLAMIGLLLRKKAKHEKWEHWEKTVMQSAFCIFMSVFVVTTFLVAPFLIFHETEEARAKAEKALNDRGPKLNGFIDQTMLGEQLGRTNSLIFLQVTIGNSGGAPSIAERYGLRVILTNKTSLDAHPVDFSDEYRMTALRTNSNIPFTLPRSELISEKTAKAIQPGEAPRGWILFELPGLFLGRYGETNYTMILSFLDINGKEIAITNGLWKGKQAKAMEYRDFPVTLPGSGNLVSHLDNQPAATETNSPAWLPPELPPESTNVTVFFGGQAITYPLTVARISTEKTGTKFAIKDLPEFMTTNIEQTPNYSPRTRNMWVKWRSIEQDYGGVKINLPIFPFVSSNRFFVEVEIPFLSERRKIIMTDEFDAALSKLPRAWDRNYSTNYYIYEVVNECTNPVLQVFYTAPNEIHVNGIFIISTNTILESFGEPPLLKFLEYHLVNITNMQEIANPSDFLTTNSLGELITNALYSIRQPGQKAIFKYPSNRYPSVPAN